MLILGSCNSGTEPENTKADFDFTIINPVSDSGIPDSVKAFYEEDAAILAVGEIWKAGSNDTANVEIPQDINQTLSNALLSIHNSNLAARDSVIEMFPIHIAFGPALRELVVSVDTSLQWVKAWMRGERLTNNTGIDRLMELYDLNLKSYNELSCCTFVLLLADRQLNLKPLFQLFEKVSGVGYAHPNGYYGYNHGIKATDMTGHWMFSYSYGWGDCPSGCLSWHTWDFNVFPDGEVEYVGSSGTPIQG